jgi:Tfp pilus assembly protein FimT
MMDVSGRTQGYSFLEITMVLSILGLFLAISIPNFADWLHTYRLRTATTTLANHLRQTRLSAVYEGVSYEVQIKDKNHGNFYQIIQDPAGLNRLVESIGKIVLDAAYTEIFITNTPLSGKITFSSRGGATTGSIVLQNSKGEQRKIVVNNTGRVKIE